MDDRSLPPTPDVRLYHRAVVVAQEATGVLVLVTVLDTCKHILTAGQQYICEYCDAVSSCGSGQGLVLGKLPLEHLTAVQLFLPF